MGREPDSPELIGSCPSSVPANLFWGLSLCLLRSCFFVFIGLPPSQTYALLSHLAERRKAAWNER